MLKNKVNRSLISGIVLTFISLNDDDFVIWHNGIALLLAIFAFTSAFFEYQKTKNL